MFLTLYYILFINKKYYSLVRSKKCQLSAHKKKPVHASAHWLFFLLEAPTITQSSANFLKKKYINSILKIHPITNFEVTVTLNFENFLKNLGNGNLN